MKIQWVRALVLLSGFIPLSVSLAQMNVHAENSAPRPSDSAGTSAFGTGAGDPVTDLQQQLDAMKALEPYLDTELKAQLKLYQEDTQIVISALNTYVSNHDKINRAFKDQISSLDGGAQFFNMLKGEAWGLEPVKLIEEKQNKFIETYGFDRRAYDHTLMRFLYQIDLQCTNLKHLGAPDAILNALASQSVDRVMAIVRASRGSRPTGFALAKPIARLIKGLYPEFDKLTDASKDLKSAIVSLKIFNERLIEYAEFTDL